MKHPCCRRGCSFVGSLVEGKRKGFKRQQEEKWKRMRKTSRRGCPRSHFQGTASQRNRFERLRRRVQLRRTQGQAEGERRGKVRKTARRAAGARRRSPCGESTSRFRASLRQQGTVDVLLLLVFDVHRVPGARLGHCRVQKRWAQRVEHIKQESNRVEGSKVQVWRKRHIRLSTERERGAAPPRCWAKTPAACR